MMAPSRHIFAQCASGFELTEMRRELNHTAPNLLTKGTAMKWKTPVIIEIAVGLEINAYACAEVK